MGSYFGKEIHISIFGQSHAECIGVLEGHGSLESDYVVRERDVVVVRGKGLLHHLEVLCILSAECHLGIVVEHELVRGARATDCAYFALDTLLAKGFLLGLGTLVLLEAEPLWGPAVWFAPAAAGSCLILLLYGLSVFRFSCRLLRACRSPEGAPLCLRRQCKDLLLFLGLGAGISLGGAGVCFLWDVLI